MTGSAFFMATQSVAEGVSIPAPVAHWAMDETSGTNVPDTSGNAYHGTCYNGANTVGNGPSWTNNATRGQCLNFDGSNDFVGAANFAIPGAFTTMAWIRPTTTGAQKTIVARRNDGIGSITSTNNAQFVFNIISTNVMRFTIFHGTAPNYVDFNGTVTIAQNTWQHVAGVYAGAGAVSAIYVNGAEDSTITFPNAMQQVVDIHHQIGCRTADLNARFFAGQMDDVRHYNVALNAQQILAIYNATVL